MKRKFSLISIAALLLIGIMALVIGCDNRNTPPKPNDDDPNTPTVTYKVKYVVNEDDYVGSLPKEASYALEAQFTVADSSVCYRNGYNLSAWNDGVKNVEPGSTYTMPARDVTFTAVWEEVNSDTQLKVTFDIGEGTTGTAPATQTHKLNESFELPDNTGFSRTGYRFSGWYDSSTSKTYKAGDEFVMPNHSVRLEAQWLDVSNVQEREVHYIKGNLLAEGTAPASESYYPGDTVTVTYLEPYSYVDHYFVCWTYNGKDYYCGDKFTMPDSDVTFTAKWDTTAGKLPVKFISDYSEGKVPSARYFNPEDADEEIVLPGQGNMTREGYKFLGWTDGKNYYDAGEKVTVGDIYNNYAKIEEYVPLRARWQNEEMDFSGVWTYGTYIKGDYPTTSTAPVHDAANVFVEMNIYINALPDTRIQVLFYTAQSPRQVDFPDLSTQAEIDEQIARQKGLVLYTLEYDVFSPNAANEYVGTRSNAKLTFDDCKLTYSTTVDTCEFFDRRDFEDDYIYDTDPRNCESRTFQYNTGTDLSYTVRFGRLSSSTGKGTGSAVESGNEMSEDGSEITVTDNYTTEFYYMGKYIVVLYYKDGSEELAGTRCFWFDEDTHLHSYIEDTHGMTGSYIFDIV